MDRTFHPRILSTTNQSHSLTLSTQFRNCEPLPQPGGKTDNTEVNMKGTSSNESFIFSGWPAAAAAERELKPGCFDHLQMHGLLIERLF